MDTIAQVMTMDIGFGDVVTPGAISLTMGGTVTDALARNVYWKNEALHHWIHNDDTLLDDVKAERTTMDKLHERLVRDRHPVSHWLYGHFHQSWYSSIDGILFRMLDIMEFCSVY